MRREPVWSHVSRTLVVLLLAVAVPPAATLVWLGLELFAQDRALLDTVVDERRQTEAQTIVNALDSSLAGAERLLTGGDVPDGMVRFTITADGVTATPANRVLWLPAAPVDRGASSASFDDADALEYGGAADRALALYEERSRASSPDTRASALLGLARIHRQAQRWDDALRVYRQLAAVDSVDVIDAPASLQARRAMVAVFDASGRKAEMLREADALRADFTNGRWVVDEHAWTLTALDIERWTGEAVPRPPERARFSAIAAALWTQSPPGAGQPAARSLLVVHDVPVTVVSREDRGVWTRLAILPSVVDAWIAEAAARVNATPNRVTLVNDALKQVSGGDATDDRAGWTTRAARDTGLPWTLAIAPGDGAPETEAFERRRRLLSMGLVAILALLAGGSYFLWRVMQRELAVGRLQTEFVAAVSHEFRTPLTSLRHVTDLLEESDDIPIGRRGALYGALGRNVDRLKRLVDSLLDFSRMESGRKPYDLQPMDAGRLVTNIVEDFRRDGAPPGFTIDLDVEAPGPLMFRVDAPSLTTAVWNLLDNAVKYSPGGQVVHVGVARHAAGVSITVRDEGLGIPSREQKEVFRRFVRGEHARRLGIKGTGLGLAMVAHITRAHRGVVEMESTEGAGSTFRLVLPSPG